MIRLQLATVEQFEDQAAGYGAGFFEANLNGIAEREDTAGMAPFENVSVGADALIGEPGKVFSYGGNSMQVAGRMAVQAGAHFLEKAHGGRGILLGGIPGVEPAHVAVIGHHTA